MTVTSLPAASVESRLVDLLEDIAAERPADLPGPASLERTRVLLEAAERARALALRGLSDVEVRQLYALEGAPSTSSWVQAQQIPGVDKRDVTLARRLSSVPQVEEELVRGAVSVAAATQVSAAVAKARPFVDRPDGLIDGQPAEPTLYGVLVDGVCTLLAEQTGGAPADDPDQERLRAELEANACSPRPERERLEAGLLAFAQRSAPTLLPSGLSLLLDALLPAQHDDRARRAEEEAGLDLHRRDDGSGWNVRGGLDNETGEMLHTLMTAEEAVDPQAPQDTEAFRAASADPDLDGVAPEHWPAAVARPRSKRAQRHDALKRGLRKLLDSGALGTRDKALPHVGITVGLDFVAGVPGALPGRATSGARWSREQVRRLLCDSAFTRFALDARRRVVEVSHTQRTATALERQILHLEWGGRCAGDGCASGPATGDRLVPHHVELFSKTGVTALGATVPLCDLDHHYLHDEQRMIRLKDGRWIGPHGWVHRQSS